MLASVIRAISGCTSSGCSSSGIYTYNKLDIISNPIDFLRKMGTSFYKAGIQYNDLVVRGPGGVVSTDDEIAKRLFGATVGVLVTTRGISTGLQAAGPLTPWTRGLVGLSEGTGVASTSAMNMQVERAL